MPRATEFADIYARLNAAQIELTELEGKHDAFYDAKLKPILEAIPEWVEWTQIGKLKWDASTKVNQIKAELRKAVEAETKNLERRL